MVTTKHTRRPVFAVTFDPRLPDLPEMQRKHWRSMTGQDEHLATVFQDPPLVAFKRQKNLSDFLIRAKLPPKLETHQKRKFILTIFLQEMCCGKSDYITIACWALSSSQ